MFTRLFRALPRISYLTLSYGKSPPSFQLFGNKFVGLVKEKRRKRLAINAGIARTRPVLLPGEVFDIMLNRLAHNTTLTRLDLHNVGMLKYKYDRLYMKLDFKMNS